MVETPEEGSGVYGFYVFWLPVYSTSAPVPVHTIAASTAAYSDSLHSLQGYKETDDLERILSLVQELMQTHHRGNDLQFPLAASETLHET